jgi:hypothetical protein
MSCLQPVRAKANRRSVLMSSAERLDCGRKLRGIGSIYGMKDALINEQHALRFVLFQGT